MKVLFIGNSHTYMNDMPELARQMIENITGEKCDAVMLAYSGRPLKWHVEEEYFSVRFNILHGGYDYCVIQEQAHPMTAMSDTEKFAGRIIKLCRQINTIPVIFETWAEKAIPANQAEMNRRYRKIAGEQGALLAPVGEAWTKIRDALGDDSDPDLYYRDGEHASAVGDYVTAMVIAKTITGKLPDKNFTKAFDFTTPDDNWIPVKENVEDETLYLSEKVIDIIRDSVDA